MDRNIESDINKLIKLDLDMLIISSGHSEYKMDETVNKLLNLDPIQIYDTIGLLNNEQVSALQQKHKVSILGRGDI